MSLLFSSPKPSLSYREKIDHEKNHLSITSLKTFLDKTISKTSPKKSSNEVANKISNIISKMKIEPGQKEIEIDTLISFAKANINDEEDGMIYKNLLILFSTSNAKIVAILKKCYDKLVSINESSLANEIEWVMMIINSEDMYNYSFELGHLKDKDEIQLIKEYSIDPLTQSKEQDMKIAKEKSSKRESVHKRASLFGKDGSLFKKLNGNFVKFSSSIINSTGKTFERKTKKSATVICKESLLVKKRKISSEQHEREDNVIEDKIKPFMIDTVTKEEKEDSEKESPKGKIDIKIDTNIEDGNDNQEPIFNFESPLPSPTNRNPLTFVQSSSPKQHNKAGQSSQSELPVIALDNTGSSSIVAQTIFDTINFNLFEYVTKVGRENALFNISNALLERNDFFSFINSSRFRPFIDKIRLGYDYLVPYHNDLHAADVLQTTHLIINSTNIKAELDLTGLDICGLFLACIVHDFKHPGVNNTYLINASHPIAVRYNDVSVLEQFHISSAFKVLSKPNSNILSDISIEEYRIIRKRMIECVLATDMAKHTSSLNSLKAKLEMLKPLVLSTGNSFFELLVNYVPDNTKFDRQQEVLNYIIHCADISNTAKPFEVCKKWTSLVMEEFFKQGDKEKKEGLPVSFLCDREKTDIPKSQISFISNIIQPCFKVLEMMIPSCSIFCNNLEVNVDMWKRISKEKEKKPSMEVV